MCGHGWGKTMVCLGVQPQWWNVENSGINFLTLRFKTRHWEKAVQKKRYPCGSDVTWTQGRPGCISINCRQTRSSTEETRPSGDTTHRRACLQRPQKAKEKARWKFSFFALYSLWGLFSLCMSFIGPFFRHSWCVLVDTNALNLILACPTNYTYQPSANSRLGLSWVKRDQTRWRVVCPTCYGVGSGSKEEAHFRIIIMMQNFEKCLLSGWGGKCCQVGCWVLFEKRKYF